MIIIYSIILIINKLLSLTGVLLPQVQDKVDTYSQPAFFGEIAMLWPVIKGAKPPRCTPQPHRQRLVEVFRCFGGVGASPL